MAKQFIYAPVNPIWLNQVKDFNPDFNTIPFDYQKPKIPYYQKYNKGDVTFLQCLSDWIPTLLVINIYGQTIDTISPSSPPNGIQNQTFIVYEFQINWASYDEDVYTIEIRYDEGTATGTSLFTSTLNQHLDTPFVGGNIVINDNGVDQIPMLDNGTQNLNLNAGDTFVIKGYAETSASSSTDPKLTMIVKKNGTTVFSKTIANVPGALLSYPGIVDEASIYETTVTGTDGGADAPDINIPDDTHFSTVTQIWRSGFIETKVNWPQTLLFQYTNSYNRFSVVWSTGIIFNLRVEGNIADYTPAFDDIIYNDQEYNTTKLNSIPHREFSLYIASNQGGFQGIPNWVADKVNWALACDQIQIDGVYYQNTNGSKWDVKRTDPDGTNFIGLKVSIIEVNNLFLNSYQQGDLPEGTLQVITRSLPFKNNSGNITIAGIFKTYSILTRIFIWNKGGDIFTISVGTAADGSEPITTPYTTTGSINDTMQLNHGFIDAETIYITGLTGTNCDIYVEYDQLDAPLIAPIVSSKLYAKGDVGMYEEVTIGDFEIEWNIGTGAGNPGTKHEGCVIAGTNGTKDRNGLLAIGWDSSMPLTRDTVVGAVGNLATIARINLPAESLAIPDLTVNTSYHTGGNSQHAAANDPSAPRARTENMGSGVPLSVANRARVTVYFVCITD